MKTLFKRPIRAYVDTSVIGGVFDKEFLKDSIIFFSLARQNYFKIVISSLVLDEIKPANEKVNRYLDEILPYAEIVDINDDAIKGCLSQRRDLNIRFYG